MYAKSAEKREQILEGARQMFLRKGYAATSMKGIVEACGISRGGLYFYYSSVQELFLDVLRSRKRTTKAMFSQLQAQHPSFRQLVEAYFAYHARRLRHMDQSLLAATIEYGFSNKTPEDRAFIEGLYDQTRELICRLLQTGVDEGAWAGDIEAMADHILFTIDGLNLKAMTVGIADAVLDEQLALLQKQVLNS